VGAEGPQVYRRIVGLHPVDMVNVQQIAVSGKVKSAIVAAEAAPGTDSRRNLSPVLRVHARPRPGRDVTRQVAEAGAEGIEELRNLESGPLLPACALRLICVIPVVDRLQAVHADA